MFEHHPPLKLVRHADVPEGRTAVIEFLVKTPGRHTIRVNALTATRGGEYTLRYEDAGGLSREQMADRQKAERRLWIAGVAWLKQRAIPLSTVEPGHGFRDLQALKPLIGDARVVALGEATHGTREFFQLKHRVFEFLVNELGFTVFAIEAPMAEGFDVNRYVLTGEGDPVKALTGLYLWPSINEEVLELIRWMRNYNADSRHRKKLRFYGIDMGHAPRIARRVLSYLGDVNPEEAAVAQRVLAELLNPLTGFNVPVEVRKGLAQPTRNFLAHFDERKADYVRRTGPGEWTLARHHARMLTQWADMDFLSRDRSMAENVAWILQQEGPDARLAVWAHNGHVKRGPGQLGGLLKQVHGLDPVVFGFAFNQGGFKAVRRSASEYTLGEVWVGPAPGDTLDAALTAAGRQVAAFPLRGIPKKGAVAEWFESQPWIQEYGAEVSGAPNHFPLRVSQAYDVLLFVDRTSPARTLPGGQQSPPPPLATPANLGFESDRPGRLPTGWIASPPGYWQAPMQKDFDWFAVASDAQPYSGHLCAEIGRTPGVHYGESAGGIAQRIDAAPYKGKRIRLRAAVRAAVTGSGNQAHLWLRVSAENHLQPLFFNAMLENPITSSGWRTYEIEGDVSQNARTIDYGLAVVGVGKAWLDTVSIEVVPSVGH